MGDVTYEKLEMFNIIWSCELRYNIPASNEWKNDRWERRPIKDGEENDGKKI